ncbi:MAG: PH domain-containing protein [Gemmatimonadales bacterium]
MSIDAEREVRSELSPGEKLLWAGQPQGGIRFRATDAFLIPFSFLCGGFAIFWEISVIRIGAPLLFRLWGVPFVLAGLYLISGRFFVDAYRRGRTYYALTSDRVMIVSGITKRIVRSLPLGSLGEVTLSERDDRSGNIVFGPGMGPTGLIGAGALRAVGPQAGPGFEMVEQARQVYEQLRAAQEAALARKV